MLYFTISAILPAVVLACGPGFGQGTTYSVVISGYRYLPLDFAASPTTYSFPWSDYSSNVETARMRIMRVSRDMFYEAINGALKELGIVRVAGLSNGASSLEIGINLLTNPPVCDDIIPAINASQTNFLKSTPGPNLPLSNTTCIVAADNMIVGLCYLGMNCTTARDNMSPARILERVSITVDNGAYSFSGMSLSSPQEKNFLKLVSKYAGIYLRSVYKVGFANAVVGISRASNGASAANTQTDDSDDLDSNII